MKRVLITGINGFIGRWLAAHLRGEGYEVYGLARGPQNDPFTLQADLTDRQSVSAAVKKIRPAIVFHLGALVGVAAGAPKDYRQHNIDGTRNLLRALRGLPPCRVFFASSAAVYGNASGAIAEDRTPAPLGDYGRSKLAGERLMQAAARENFHAVTLCRLFNVVGPGQRETFFIPKLAAHFIRRAPCIKLGNLDTRRDYIDVRSVCAFMAALIYQPPAFGQAINFCSGKGWSGKDLIRAFCDITGHDIMVDAEQDGMSPASPPILIGDNHKLRRLLPHPFRPMPLHTVLEEILAHGPHTPRFRPGLPNSVAHTIKDGP